MKRTLQIANILAFILTLVVNYLSNSLPLNGRTPGELSNLYPNLFVPAPFTFAIWGLIYLLLIGFVVYQASDLFAKKKKDLPFVEKIGWLFVISCLLNAAWLFAWHYEILWLSVLIMVGLLITLITIYQRLRIGRNKGKVKGMIFLRLPFQVYLGWISIAIIANISAFLVSVGFRGGGIPEHVWAIIMISFGGLLALLMLYKKWDIAYSLVVIWAFNGIINERMEMMDFGFMGIVIASITCIALIVIGILMRAVQILRSERS